MMTFSRKVVGLVQQSAVLCGSFTSYHFTLFYADHSKRPQTTTFVVNLELVLKTEVLEPSWDKTGYSSDTVVFGSTP